jgi:hypothetical protein
VSLGEVAEKAGEEQAGKEAGRQADESRVLCRQPKKKIENEHQERE